MKQLMVFNEEKMSKQQLFELVPFNFLINISESKKPELTALF